MSTLRDLVAEAIRRVEKNPPHPYGTPSQAYQEPFEDFAERAARWCGIKRSERLSREALEQRFADFLSETGQRIR